MRCPICRESLGPHGTAGMTCPRGHSFLRADIERGQTVTVKNRKVPVRPWLPGAVLGGLAVVIALVDLVL